MIQKIQLSQGTVLNREHSRDDCGDHVITGWYLTDETGRDQDHDLIHHTFLEWIETVANDVDEFDGRRFLADGIDDALESRLDECRVRSASGPAYQVGQARIVDRDVARVELGKGGM